VINHPQLLDRWREPGTPLENSIYKLLSKIAKEMEAAGSNPPHRFGRGRIFGQRLSNLLQRQVRSRCATRHSTPVPFAAEASQGQNIGHLNVPSHQIGTTPNPFQASGSGNAFLAAPSLVQNQHHQNNQDHTLNSNQQLNNEQDNMLDFNTLFDFDSFSLPQSEFDMTGLSEDKLNELLPSDCWLPVGTDDLMDIAAQFGHQVINRVHYIPQGEK